jgi:flagellar biosynthesis/type III secretory pathway protein FliH
MTEREQYDDLCEQLGLTKSDELFILFAAAHDRGYQKGKKEGYEKGYYDCDAEQIGGCTEEWSC